MKQISTNLLLIIGTIAIASSCTGQIISQNATESKKEIELGKPVSKLDTTIWNIYQDKKSNYWFSSKENGVYRYNGENLIQFTSKDGLVSNETREIQEDNLGNIFIETTKGISKYDGHSFETLKIKEETISTNEWKLEPDDLWFRIGFDKKGPYRYDGEYLHALTFPKSPQEERFNKQGAVSFSPYGIYTMYKDSKGHMWFGTASLGACRYDGNSFSWHYEEQLQTTPEGGDFGTRAIFEDKDDYYWFNNTRHRYQILPSIVPALQFKKEEGMGFLNENNEMEFPFFHGIEQDDEGHLWMVTYGDGVWRYDGKELANYQIRDGDTDVLFFTIFKDNKGVLWLGTHNAGVYKYNGETFVKFEL